MPNVVLDKGPNGLDLALASNTGWESPGSLVLPNGDRIQRSSVNASNPGAYIDGTSKRFTPDWGVSDWCLELVLMGFGGGSTSVGTVPVASYGDGAGTTFSWALNINSTYNISALAMYLSTGSTYNVGAGFTYNLSGAVCHIVYNVKSSTGISNFQWQQFVNNALTSGTSPGGGTPRALGIDWRFRLFNSKNNASLDTARGKVSVYNRMLSVMEVNQRYLALTSV